MAGGSPMYVSGWGAVGGSHAINATFTQAQINAMAQYPRDGTVVRNYGSGAIYVVAGGFPFAVTSLSNVPYTTWTNVDGSAISSQLRSQPGDGTVVRNYTTGAVYVVSGGAPLAIMSMNSIPYTNFTNIDGWGITNQLRQYPTDGSVIVDFNTSVVYVVAGGSPMAVNSFGNIPPVTSMAYVDDWAVHNQLRQYPANGTVIRNYVSGAISVIAGGASLSIMSLSSVPYTSWVNIDGASIVNQLRSYPVDGTFVVGYGSGRVYKIQGQQAIYISDMSRVTGTLTSVDDWAIVNQLGGAE
jgi:hypothetical protein